MITNALINDHSYPKPASNRAANTAAKLTLIRSKRMARCSESLTFKGSVFALNRVFIQTL